MDAGCLVTGATPHIMLGEVDCVFKGPDSLECRARRHARV